MSIDLPSRWFLIWDNQSYHQRESMLNLFPTYSVQEAFYFSKRGQK